MSETSLPYYPPDLDAYVEQKVRSGQFRSREDFAIEAARLYRDVESRHQSLKSDIAEALEQVKQGKTIPMDIEALKQELLEQLDGQGNPRK